MAGTYQLIGNRFELNFIFLLYSQVKNYIPYFKQIQVLSPLICGKISKLTQKDSRIKFKTRASSSFQKILYIIYFDRPTENTEKITSQSKIYYKLPTLFERNNKLHAKSFFCMLSSVKTRSALICRGFLK